MKFRLHYLIISVLIKVYPKLFERYFDEYTDVYRKYLIKENNDFCKHHRRHIK